MIKSLGHERKNVKALKNSQHYRRKTFPNLSSHKRYVQWKANVKTFCLVVQSEKLSISGAFSWNAGATKEGKWVKIWGLCSGLREDFFFILNFLSSPSPSPCLFRETNFLCYLFCSLDARRRWCIAADAIFICSHSLPFLWFFLLFLLMKKESFEKTHSYNFPTRCFQIKERNKVEPVTELCARVFPT